MRAHPFVWRYPVTNESFSTRIKVHIFFPSYPTCLNVYHGGLRFRRNSFWDPLICTRYDVITKSCSCKCALQQALPYPKHNFMKRPIILHPDPRLKKTSLYISMLCVFWGTNSSIKHKIYIVKNFWFFFKNFKFLIVFKKKYQGLRANKTTKINLF